jgi:hypothetical protein
MSFDMTNCEKIACLATQREPTMTPWEKLSAEEREDLIHDAMAFYFCECVKIGDVSAAHRTFVSMRSTEGWTRGPKDIKARTSPLIAPWTELDESGQRRQSALYDAARETVDVTLRFTHPLN